MPKRTAADFAREAAADGPWTFTTETGQDLVPRPRSAFTYDEGRAEADLMYEWAKRGALANRGETPTGPDPESPFHFDLKIRFSAPNVYVEAREQPTGADVELPDYDAFWAEVQTWPLESIRALITELDEYYPLADPGSDKEQADAAAAPAGDTAGKSESAATL